MRRKNKERIKTITGTILEILATGALTSGSLAGDFQDRGLTGWTWRAEVSASGVNNLDYFQVTVTDPTNFTAEVDGLQYVPPPVDTTGAG